jgi:shikimate kinase
MKTNIALIGFMGVGKTAVGKALAEKVGRSFVEMDLLIEQRKGKSISDIFQQDGEAAFRELEIEVTEDISKGKNLVIACGGGVVLNKVNIERLRKSARMVYLTASPGVILKRVASGEGKRPLLKVDNPSIAICEMLSFREPFYARAADIKVDTSKLGINAVAEQIIDKLGREKQHH